MTNHCEHCTFWQGSASSSRADCTHPNTIGTTSFDDTCVHHKSKAAAIPVKIDENGKISGWRLTSGGVVSTGTKVYIGSNGKITADSAQSLPIGIVSSGAKDLTIPGNLTMPDIVNDRTFAAKRNG